MLWCKKTGSNKLFCFLDVLGMIRLNPVHASEDDSHVFRVFGNLEAYHINDVNQDKISHGIDESSEAPPTLEFIEQWINKATSPLKFVASDVIWASYFRINERIANGFRRERAFLIGGTYLCCLVFKNDQYLIYFYSYRCCSLPFTCWRTRHEFRFTRWYVCILCIYNSVPNS